MFDGIDTSVDGPARKAEAGVVEPAPPRDTQLNPDEPHLLDYVRVLYKRRWLAGTAFAVIVLAAVVYVFTATPMYEGDAQLLIEPENPNIVSFKEVVDQDQAKADYYQTQYKLLESRELAGKTIGALRLESSRDLSPGPSAMGRLAALFRHQPPVSAIEDPDAAAATQSKLIDAFLAHLTVTPVRNSRLVDVTYRSADPRTAAAVANAVATGYIQQNQQFNSLSTREASDWLNQQLAEQRKAVGESEAALQHYLENNAAVAIDQRQDIVVQKLVDVNAAVTRAKTDRIAKETVYRQLQAIQGNQAALDTFPNILLNPFIQQQKATLAELQRQLASMSEKLGARHPDIIKVKSSIQSVDAKLQAEIAKVVDSVRVDYETSKAQEQSLVGALEQQKAEALGQNRKGIEFAVLQREAESNRQIYNTLLQRAKETGISAELKTSNIRVVDTAGVPVDPVSPKRAVDLLAALFGGAIAAAGLAFFFEYLDNRIKNPDEIKAHLGLPSLGMIPAMDGKTFDAAYPLINNGVPPGFAEAFRTVRTNILFSSAQPGCRSILVTSTSPGEGKTVVSTNMAMALAQAGQRVLLIDADMRRPQVHRTLALPQEPGLSNLLVSTAKASECITKTEVEGLWVLPAGRIPPNPAELLGSARCRNFFDSLGEHFDWVVVDTPPAMAVADASVLAHLVTGVVFVIGAEMTSRHGAKAALDQLEQAQARFVGAVLNKVDLAANPYYYSQYYRKEYAKYYVNAGA